MRAAVTTASTVEENEKAEIRALKSILAAGLATQGKGEGTSRS